MSRTCAVVARVILATFTTPVMAQEPCPDTLAWTRTLAVKLGQSRAQAEIEAAQAQARIQKLEADVQRLTEELRRAHGDVKDTK